MNSPVYGEALTLKGVMGTSDSDRWRKVLVMGSVWLFPSTASITTC
jgi:hypothetical protein